ncbi:Hypothetical_protein [Hexamita inflata]|uniref:Hypothetical_protein n=1 Tax=Hexamita inflata TaxID=28002 RepID=A0AA86NNC1_9EUKA|nr:Hypothetical protein HINF_LOCUS9876 [Hexamita inflata]
MLQQVSETTFYVNRRYIFQHIAKAGYLSFICFSSIELIFDHVSEVKIWSVITKIKQILLDFQGSRKALLNHKIQLLQLNCFLKHITVLNISNNYSNDLFLLECEYFAHSRYFEYYNQKQPTVELLLIDKKIDKIYYSIDLFEFRLELKQDVCALLNTLNNDGYE